MADQSLSRPDLSDIDNIKRWTASILLTGVFCAVQVNRSMRAGALALPTQYDDISYYLTGAEYLQRFYNGGFLDVLKAYLANPPHAPLSTGLAFLGFLLFGLNAWAGPVTNGILFLFFVRWFFSFAKEIPFFRTCTLAVALLGFPFVTATIMNFRPDMFCGLLLACGTFFIVARSRWLEEPRDQIVAGLMLAAALWSKPTVFHLSIALFCGAIFLASFATLLRGNFKQVVVAALLTLGTGILLSLPYYAFAARHVIEYIWTTAYGSESSIWVRSIPLSEHVLFYLTGPYGQSFLGAWLYASSVLGGCALVVLWHSDRELFQRAMLAVFLVAMTYLSVTIPSFKGPHGSPFAAIVFVSAAAASTILNRKAPAVVGWTICMALIGFSAVQFSWPSTAVPARYAESRWSMVRQALDAIGPNASDKRFLLTTSAVYLNYSILAFEYYRLGLSPPDSDNTQLVGDLEEQRRRIGAADIVFALTPDFTEVFPHLPTASPEFRAQLIKTIEEDGHHFKLKSRIPDPFSKGAALIYTRSIDSFSRFSQVEGLREEEGPYPQWKLPRVRWGWGAQTKLTMEGVPDTRSRLLIDARSVGLPNQVLTIFVNNERKAQAPLIDAFISLEAIVEFNHEGRAEIVLKYSVPSDTAVLYKTISLQPLDEIR